MTNENHLGNGIQIQFPTNLGDANENCSTLPTSRWFRITFNSVGKSEYENYRKMTSWQMIMWNENLCCILLRSHICEVNLGSENFEIISWQMKMWNEN